MKHPMIWTLAVLAAAALPALWSNRLAPSPTLAQQPAAKSAAEGSRGLPWQVDVQPDGTSRVLGLHLGSDTLAQVRVRSGDALQVAIVARLGEVGELEALADPYSAGFVTGRLVASFAVSPEKLRRWREAAVDSAPMEGGVRRFNLRAQDRAEADQAPLRGLSFVPTARLDADDLRVRFGAPETQTTLEGGVTLLSYPTRGVTAAVAEGQRAVIEYRAPRDALQAAASAGP